MEEAGRGWMSAAALHLISTSELMTCTMENDENGDGALLGRAKKKGQQQASWGIETRSSDLI